jgi:hypothetical protein
MSRHKHWNFLSIASESEMRVGSKAEGNTSILLFALLQSCRPANGTEEAIIIHALTLRSGSLVPLYLTFPSFILSLFMYFDFFFSSVEFPQ